MKKYINRGFTLIELLVVITLIAILAVAILAAINPVEQRRRAQDTGVSSAASQLVSAFERFYTSYGCFPQDATVTGGAGGTVACGTATTGIITAANTTAAVTNLVNVGEIKDNSVLTRITSANVSHVLSIASNQTVHLCYIPASNSFKGNAKRNNLGAAGTGTGYNFYCIPDTQ